MNINGGHRYGEKSDFESRVVLKSDPPEFTYVVVYRLFMHTPHARAGLGFYFTRVRASEVPRDVLLAHYGSEASMRRWVENNARLYLATDEDRWLIMEVTEADYRGRGRLIPYLFDTRNYRLTKPQKKEEDEIAESTILFNELKAWVAKETFLTEKQEAVRGQSVLKRLEVKTLPDDDLSLRQAMTTLALIHSRNSILLGLGLYRISSRQLYLDWGHPSFESYVELELGWNFHRAYSYARVGRFMAEMGIDTETAQELKWTKLQAMAALREIHNVASVIDYAKQHNINQVKAHVATILGKSALRYTQKETVKMVLEIARQEHHEAKELIEDLWDRDKYKDRGQLILTALRLLASVELQDRQAS